MYKCLTLLFNKEFIFNSGDELKDFNDSLSYLLHTNLLKLTNNGREFELVKFNMRTFFFFSRAFLYIFQNYSAIYTSLEQTPGFESEKDLTKSVQTSLFGKMLASLATPNSRDLFDFEGLSLNLISNAVLSLRQFGILQKNAASHYEISTSQLAKLNETLKFIVKINRLKLQTLSKIVREFEVVNKLDTNANEGMFDVDAFRYSQVDSIELTELTHQNYACFGTGKNKGLAKL